MYNSQHVSFTVHIHWSTKMSKSKLTQGGLWHCCGAAFRLRVWIVYYMYRIHEAHHKIHLRRQCPEIEGQISSAHSTQSGL